MEEKEQMEDLTQERKSRTFATPVHLKAKKEESADEMMAAERHFGAHNCVVLSGGIDYMFSNCEDTVKEGEPSNQ